jgi:hypothetical protein
MGNFRNLTDNTDKLSGFNDKCIIIKIHQKTVSERGSVYHAVRHCWRINIDRANRADYVLGVINGVVKGVFKPGDWFYFPEKECKSLNCGNKKIPCGRKAFNGKDADENAKNKYLDKYIPDEYRRSRNPILYTYEYS